MADATSRIVSLGMISLFAAAGAGASGSERPNILMVLIDDTDQSMVNAYRDNMRYLTPTLDQIGRESARFTNAHVVSTVCTPSRYAFQTGRFSGRCCAEHFVERYPVSEPYCVDFEVRLEDDSPSLARTLKDSGYYTGFSGKWHIGQFDKELGLPPFDLNADPLNPQVEEQLRLYQQTFVEEVKRTAGYEYVRNVFTGNANCWFLPKAVHHHNLEWITSGALDFLNQWDQTRPFFFFFSPTVLHGPGFEASLKADMSITQGWRCSGLDQVQAPRETLARRLKEAGLPPNNENLAYLWLDDSLAAIIKKLKAMGAYENTVIVFAADHGNYPHKATCYDGGSRIPLMVRWPGHLKGGEKIDALVSSVDVVPTLLDIAQADPADIPLDGRSLMPVLTGEKAEVNDAVYVEFGYSRAVFDGRWKYIAVRFPDRMIEEMKAGKRSQAPTLMGNPHVLQAIAFSGHPDLLTPDQLYDRSADPKEMKNLVTNPEYKQQLLRMKTLLAGYTAELDRPFPVEADPFYFSSEYKALVKKTEGSMPLPDWYGGGGK